MSIKSRDLTLLALAFLCTACARSLVIRSDPTAADVTLNDIAAGQTPLVVNLAQFNHDGNIKILVKKPEFGSFSGYIPGPTAATLGSEIDIVIPKEENEAEKLSRQMNLVLKAQKLALTQNAPEAIRLLDASLKEYPRFAALFLTKANILFLVNNYDGALAQYRKVLQIDPTNEEAITMVEFFRKRAPIEAPNRSLAHAKRRVAAVLAKPAAKPVAIPAVTPVTRTAVTPTPVSIPVATPPATQLGFPASFPDTSSGSKPAGQGSGFTDDFGNGEEPPSDTEDDTGGE